MEIREKEVLLVFRHLLKLFDVPVSCSSLNEYWQAHPDYLSMVFFADACEKYKINYAALEVSRADLGKNGFPFITHLVNEGGHFVVVEDINKETQEITYYHPSKGYVTGPLKDFLEHWSGSVFYALPNDQSGEPHYFRKRVKEIVGRQAYPLFGIILFLLLGNSLFLIHPILAQPFLLLLGVKIAGLFICITLLHHELIGENRISQAVCRNGKYTSCDEVLQSPASHLWGISMSDLGFVYFSGGVISLIFSLFLNIQSVTLTVLFILTLCTIPYAWFSVYYQLIKIRKVCPFCMSVIATLVLEWIVVFSHWKAMEMGYTSWWLLFPLGCMLWVVCGWIIVKPVIQKAKDGTTYKYKYLRLKKNPHIFNASLEKKNATDMDIIENELRIGNPDATTTITYVINTHCAPCARMHRRIHSIVEDFGKDICVVVRFMPANNNRQETLFLIRLYHSQGASVFSEALHEWFQHKNYNQLVQQYSEVKEYALENELIQHWTKWFDKEDISSTPTLFLNDKKIDQEYDIDDIYWLVQNNLYDTLSN